MTHAKSGFGIRRGRSEMQHILRNWSNFTPNDFVALKDKYGV